ncbi:hypothetical protein SR882_10945 [Guyparkeria halophila]|uniref:RcnB family protein n=1 Tax=Guyparkeria halophila TaxID=47960 RepID=A0ABZ0YYA8_9GAMM|nr:hypothetical protein [Guyparkeria halophila]WQH16262.1 hypothetical protein SR882_10945 [Guyparkeria halophila]
MIHRILTAMLATGTALLIGQASAMAQPPEHAGKPGQPPGSAQQGGPDRHSMANPPERQAERERHTSRYHISTRERMYIRDWYQRNLPPGLAKQGKVPPGLAKQGKVPPGHAKRLQRGSTWPPRDIEYERLPRELVRNLSPLPDHMRYYRVGPDVVIADTAGNVVSDIVYDILN